MIYSSSGRFPALLVEKSEDVEGKGESTFDQVVVNLTRPSSKCGEDGELLFPWGLKFGQAPLLMGCPKGIAARSKKARDCIGMVVTKVGETLVYSADDVTRAIAGRTSITLHFSPTNPSKKDGKHRQVGSPQLPVQACNKTAALFPSSFHFPSAGHRRYISK